MRNVIAFLSAVVISLSITSTASAQTQPMTFRALDKNGDGVITAEEAGPDMWSRISPSDLNGDGGVTGREMTVAHQESLRARHTS